MNPSQVNFLKDSYMQESKKPNGQKGTLGEYMEFMFDNCITYVTTKEMVIFDDAHEMIHCVMPNSDQYTQCDFPVKIMSGDMSALQQVASIMTQDNLDKLIDSGFLGTLISDEKKEFIKKWTRDHWRNQGLQPIDADPYYDPAKEPMVIPMAKTMIEATPYKPKIEVVDGDGKSTYYDTVEEAIASASNGATINMTESATIPADTSISYNSDVTINLNGNDIIVEGEQLVPLFTVTDNAILTFTGSGNIKSENIAIVVSENSTVEIGGAVSVTSTDNAAIYLEDNGSAIITGGIVATESGEPAITADDDATGTIAITGGHISTNGEVAVYHPNDSLITINGGEFNCEIALLLTNGTAVIDGPVKMITGTKGEVVEGSIPIRGTKDTIRVEYTDNKQPKIAITNGYFESNDGLAFECYDASGNAKPDAAIGNVLISGGTFSSAIDEMYLDETKMCVETDDGMYTIVVDPGVAAVNGNGYKTLQKAIDAAETDSVITLLKNAASATIPEGKKITIELDGHNISGEMFGLTNNGELVVNDSIDSGCVYSTNTDAQNRPAIINNGTLTVNAGWFGDSNTDKTNANTVQRGVAISNFGTATVNGGHYTACDNFTNGGYAYALVNRNADSTMIVNNADIYGNMNGAFAADDGNITVEYANVDLPGDKTYYVFYADAGHIAVHDGVYSKTGNTRPIAYEDSSGGTVRISGGKFNRPIDQKFCADTYIPCGPDTDGMYSVKLDTEIKIDDDEYMTVEEAIAAAGDGSTMVLLKNIDRSVDIPEGKNVIIDLNGHNISGEMYGITNNGTLVLRDATDSGCVYSTNIDAQNRPAIINNGNLTVEAGWYGDSDNDKTNANEIQRGVSVSNFGTAAINGGHYTACDNFTNGGYAYALVNRTAESAMTVKNADIYGNMNGAFAADDGEVTIENATVDLPGDKTYYVFYADAGHIFVNGGMFSKTGNTRATAYEDKAGGTVRISGGKFNRPIDQKFCADKYEPYGPDENGLYGVRITSIEGGGEPMEEGEEN